MASAFPEAVIARLRDAGGHTPVGADRVVVEALERGLQTAQAAWPGVDVPAGALAELWSERLLGVPSEKLATAIDALPVADLYIACGCALGFGAALATFEAKYFTGIPKAVARATGSAAEVGEVAQMLREKLFVAKAGQPPRILKLAGRGDLGGLIRLIALRTALNLRRAQRRIVSTADDSLLEALTPPVDEEATPIRGEQRALIKQAFEHALGQLAARDRNVLRMHLQHRLSIDEIGRAHGVHRATAARWLSKIRQDLRFATLAQLRTKVGDREDEVHSLTRAVESGIAISFARLLAS